MTDGETTIRPLSETTVQRIAAGEVVERPASVVKELVENSLDAAASRISVRVDGGGTERIVVTDDGVGMNEADVQVAVEEHTTSKIRDIDDLESGVSTLGFRGEALYTIGAVTRMSIRTKPRGGERGTELQLVGGDVENVGAAGCPEGTTVEVTELFFNTPARQKYLKADSTEFSHVNRVVTQYALANPDVAFSLEHDGREVFATTGQGNLQSAILSVYGREVATAMISVDGSADVNVSGYVSHPETTRSTREYVATYVNGRYVRSAVVREAVLAAYGNQLAPDRYPFAVLFLDVPGDSVDVNVHPRKMEVRFGDEGSIRQNVRDAVKDALLDEGLVRSSAPRGRSAPEETGVSPEGVQSQLDPETDTGEPNIEETASRESTDEQETSPRARRTEQAETPNAQTDRATEVESADNSASRRLARGGATDADSTAPTGRSKSVDAGDTTSKQGRASRARATTDEESDPTSARDSPPARETVDSRREPDRKFRATTETRRLVESSKEESAEFDSLPPMRVLGQLHDTYVVAETPNGLVLVDQHAADERVNYERLREQFAGDTTTQVLAAPVELELTAAEAALFDEYREALARLGFHAARVSRSTAEKSSGGEPRDRKGERAVEVTTVPAVLSETLSPDLLRDVLSEFVSADTDEREQNSAEAVADALISDLACYPSVTGNTSLREGDVVRLLSALDDCENPYACPHGRPVVIEFAGQEIENRFERDYPGHAGRRSE